MANITAGRKYKLDGLTVKVLNITSVDIVGLVGKERTLDLTGDWCLVEYIGHVKCSGHRVRRSELRPMAEPPYAPHPSRLRY